MPLPARSANRRSFAESAIRALQEEAASCRPTELIRIELPFTDRIALYLKDESAHPTGSLKHRLARSLFTYAICNDWIGDGTPVVEASSGSTAVSEAYFARLLDLPFHAVMPRSTSVEKIAAIERYGGQCRLVEDGACTSAAARDFARAIGGHFMDQFTYAERASDWRSTSNLGEELLAQLGERPAWIVCGAGTGGTLATFGRHLRYTCCGARLCLADPTDSIFNRILAGEAVALMPRQSLVEGIGRREVTGSFVPSLVDRAIVVPDEASIAAARFLGGILGRPCGGSTGTNFWAVAALVSEMLETGESGTIVSILCDSGERYRSSYHNDGWIAERGLELDRPRLALEHFWQTGRFDRSL